MGPTHGSSFPFLLQSGFGCLLETGILRGTRLTWPSLGDSRGTNSQRKTMLSLVKQLPLSHLRHEAPSLSFSCLFFFPQVFHIACLIVMRENKRVTGAKKHQFKCQLKEKIVFPAIAALLHNVKTISVWKEEWFTFLKWMWQQLRTILRYLVLLC